MTIRKSLMESDVLHDAVFFRAASTAAAASAERATVTRPVGYDLSPCVTSARRDSNSQPHGLYSPPTTTKLSI